MSVLSMVTTFLRRQALDRRRWCHLDRMSTYGGILL